MIGDRERRIRIEGRWAREVAVHRRRGEGEERARKGEEERVRQRRAEVGGRTERMVEGEMGGSRRCGRMVDICL